MKRTAKRTNTAAAPTGAPRETDRFEPDARSPGPLTRWLLSLFLLFHFVAAAVSFFSAIEPSRTQLRLLDLARPYLIATRFGIGDRPIYLAHGDPSEQPLRLQVSREASPGRGDWRTVRPPGKPGLASGDRYGRWLSTAAMLAEGDQPGLVAELLVPAVNSDDAINAVRIVRLPTQLTTVLDESQPPPYEGRVIRNGKTVLLIHTPAKDKSAVAIPRGGNRAP